MKPDPLDSVMPFMPSAECLRDKVKNIKFERRQAEKEAKVKQEAELAARRQVIQNSIIPKIIKTIKETCLADPEAGVQQFDISKLSGQVGDNDEEAKFIAEYLAQYLRHPMLKYHTLVMRHWIPEDPGSALALPTPGYYRISLRVVWAELPMGADSY